MAEPSLQPERGSLPHTQSRALFVGRQREMAELTSALEDALSGRGRLVMLVGEPGIGKTRTAQELGSLAETRGAQVFWGRCYEEEGTPPYWPWVQALRSYIQHSSVELLTTEMGRGAAAIADIVPEIHDKITDLPPLPAPPYSKPPDTKYFLC